jgi:signal transduction histidine kinase
MSLSINSIYSSSLRLLANENSSDIYSLVLDEILKLTKSSAGTLYIYENNVLKPVKDAQVIRRPLPRKNGYTYTAFKNRTPLVVPRNIIDRIHEESKEINGKSWVFIPLSYQTTTYGIINVLSDLTPNHINKNINSLLIFGAMASLAIKNAWHVVEMQKAIKTRDAFISMANHELKTPLTTVMAYAQIIERAVKQGKLPSIGWVDQLVKESKRQKSILDELFAIDQINSGQFRYVFKKCNLKNLLTQITQASKARFPARKFNFIYEECADGTVPEIQADADKLTQAVTNLINNAVKYTDSDITVKLTCNDVDFKISVSDRGCGIPKKEIPRLFTLFHRGNHKTKKGLGIGLYIAKQVINSHNGTIEIESLKNQGTTFTIHLSKIGINA